MESWTTQLDQRFVDFFKYSKLITEKISPLNHKPQKKRLILRYVELLRKKCIKKIKKKDFLISGFTRKEKP